MSIYLNNYLYASRAENWLKRQNGENISKEEWGVFVSKDDELRPIENTTEAVDYLGEPIYWKNGEIYCIDPDEVTFYKILEIANTIDAIIRGNDGRVYFSIKSFYYPSEITVVDNPTLLKFEKQLINRTRPLWKKIFNIGKVK